jgi:RHS repeat-associated protein
VVTSDTTLENNKVKRVTYVYDRFNNVTNETEYDFATNPNQATKLRESVRSYVTTLNGYCYTSVYSGCSGSVVAPSNGIIHQRRLPASETINDASGNLEAYSEPEYDNYVSDGGNHAPIVINSNMNQYDAARFSYLNDPLHEPRGNVTRLKKLISGTITTGMYATTYSQYDNAGNVVFAKDAKGNSTSISYQDNFGDGSNPDTGTYNPASPTFALVNSITNALSHVVKTQYDYTRGAPTGVKDANGTITQATYDSYDRPVIITAAVAKPEATITQMSYPAAGVNESKVSKQLDATRWLTSRTQFDGFGRAVLVSQTEDGMKFDNSPSYTIHKKAIYDGLGRPWKVSNPYRSASAPTDGWTRTSFDLAGRAVEVASFGADANNTPPPDTGTAGSTGYSGNVTTGYASEVNTVTDQAGKIRRSTVDGLGRLIKVEEMQNASTVYATTNYAYDSRGNLTQVNQTNNGASQIRRFAYDLLSRLIFAANPEQNTSTDPLFTYNSQQWAVKYDYDAASNLTAKTDTRKDSANQFVKVEYSYDALNRNYLRHYSAGSPYATADVTYQYDPGITNGKGRIGSVTSSGVSTYNFTAYDAMGRPTAYNQATVTPSGTQTYSMENSYNQAGLVTRQKYPSTKEVMTEYDDAGRIAGVRNNASSAYYAGAVPTDSTNRIQYTAHGAVSKLRLGNLLWEHTNFNTRLQPEQIGLGTATTNSSVLQLDYTFGATTSTNNGNVASQVITINATTQINQSYTYDQVNRLKTFTETGSWSQTYNYDEAGNRWVSAGNVPTPSLTLQSQQSFVAGTNRINTSVMSGFGYDQAGNQTSMPNLVSGTDAVAYDAESHQTNYGASTYSYDGEGRRVRKQVGSTTTLFAYNSAGQLLAQYDSSAGSAPLSVTKYLTTDHLGSTRAVTGQNQSVVARYDYLPFGEEMGAGVGVRTGGMGYGNDATRQKFTQKERDNESGLDYFLARYYSSAQGRFTSPDEFAGGPRDLFDFADSASANPTSYADIVDPQTLNKYQYGLNNPLKYIDPDGHQEKKTLTDQVNEALSAVWESTGGRLFGNKEKSPREEASQNPNIGPGGPLPTTGELITRANTQAGKAFEKLADMYALLFDRTGFVTLAGTILRYQHGQADRNDIILAAAGAALNFAPGRALSHFEKHSLEWGLGKFNTEAEYVAGARDLIRSADSNVVRYMNDSGKILVYNKATNELATHTAGRIHTFFKPKKGEKYVNGVIKKERYKQL